MPKLDGTHMVERLIKRIAQLEAAEEVAAKDIHALLTDAQIEELNIAWTAQEKVRLGKKARTDEEKLTLGWKTKREVRLEIFRQALCAAENGELDAWKKKLKDANIRQARIYFDALSAAEKAGKDKREAQIFANNELTRAGLKRMDEMLAAAAGKEIWRKL